MTEKSLELQLVAAQAKGFAHLLRQWVEGPTDCIEEIACFTELLSRDDNHLLNNILKDSVYPISFFLPKSREDEKVTADQARRALRHYARLLTKFAKEYGVRMVVYSESSFCKKLTFAECKSITGWAVPSYINAGAHIGEIGVPPGIVKKFERASVLSIKDLAEIKSACGCVKWSEVLCELQGFSIPTAAKVADIMRESGLSPQFQSE